MNPSLIYLLVAQELTAVGKKKMCFSWPELVDRVKVLSHAPPTEAVVTTSTVLLKTSTLSTEGPVSFIKDSISCPSVPQTFPCPFTHMHFS